MTEYRDSTPNNFPDDYEQSQVDERVLKRTKSVREKMYGLDTREAMAQAEEITSVVANEAKEIAGNTETRQTDLEQRYNDQISGNTDIDEVIDARRPTGRDTYPTLNQRLDQQIGLDSDFRKFEDSESFMRRVNNEMTERGINVKWFGAKGDGLTDDIETLKIASNNDSNNLFFPEGSYKIKSGLPLKNGVYRGVRGKSKILVNDDFEKGVSQPSNEFAIYNQNFSLTYNDTTANDITIEDMVLEFNFTTSTSTPISAVLGFANIKKCVLRNVDIIINSVNPVYSVGFDFYAAFKNVVLENVTVYMNTNYATGGNWFRNFSTDYSGASACENIKVKNLKITKNCGDEHLAIYGLKNMIKNVEIDGLYIEQPSNTTVAMDNMISIFGSDIAPWDDVNGKVENVKIHNFYVNARKYNSFIFQVGNSSLKGDVKNIEISDGFIDNDSVSNAIVRSYPYCQNVKFNNNIVTFLNAKKVTNGVMTLDEAKNNRFYGTNNCDNLFNNVGDVINNTALDNSCITFAYDCKNIISNRAKIDTSFVTNRIQKRVKVIDNEITGIKGNVNFINFNKNVSNANFACEGIIQGNSFVPFDNTNRMILSNNELVVIKSKNNYSETAMKYVFTPAGRVFESENNVIAGGVVDSLRNAVVADWDLGQSLHVGYVVKSSMLNADIIGWRKTGWTSGAGTWQTIKTAT